MTGWSERYAQWLRQQQRHADNTRLASQRDIAALQRLLSGATSPGADTPEPQWSALGADDVRAALSRARVSGASAATLARMASSWRGFFRYLSEQGVVQQDLLQGVRTPRKPRRLPKALSPDEAQQLLENAAESEASADSDPDGLHMAQVLAELLYGSGLRISEALGLDRSEADWRARSRASACLGGWIDWSANELHILGKGNKPRILPLTSQARTRLQSWLQHPVVWPAGVQERPVFVSARGRRLPVRSAQRLLAALAGQSGLDRAVHPHMLRHSFASHVLQSSGDLRAVQELMGHASIASTQVYTALDFQHLSAVYDKAHPRARKADK